MSTFENVHLAPKKKPKEDLWLMSYADLITNLMAVFIMMLAISTVDTQKFDAISAKMSSVQRKNTLDELQRKVDAEIKARGLESRVTTLMSLSGLNVEFLSGVLFESASAELTQENFKGALPILDILSKTDSKYFLSFEGHTDDVPFRRNGKYRDNWDLSSARGAALLAKMRELGVPETRMSVAGYAHTRPKTPIEGKSGKDLESARASNRRVVIRVYQ